MALRVLGSVKEQTEHGGGQTRAADGSDLFERAQRRRPNVGERAIDGVVSGPHQGFGALWRIPVLTFCRERRALGGVQPVAARIRQQSIQASRQMPEMESDRRRAAGPRPEVFGRQRSHRRDLFAHLQQRVRHRLQFVRVVRQRTA